MHLFILGKEDSHVIISAEGLCKQGHGRRAIPAAANSRIMSLRLQVLDSMEFESWISK